VQNKHPNIKQVAADTALALDLYSEALLADANDEKTKDVVQKIKSDEFEKPDPQRFLRSVSTDAKHPEMLSAYSTANYVTMKLFKLEGYNIGYAIKSDGDLVSVHNNEHDVAGIGEILVESAVSHGATKLDHFDIPILNKIYQKFGFREYKRYPFDPQYVSADFIRKYGKPDVIMRSRTLSENKMKEIMHNFMLSESLFGLDEAVDSRPELYLPVGISGSGKSSYIRKNFDPSIVIEPDAIRREVTGSVSDQSQENKVWGIVFARLRKTLQQYGKAVLDATNVRSRNRMSVLKMFKNAKKIAIVFDADPEIAKQRVAKDISNKVDRSNVPADVIDRQYAAFKQDYPLINQQFDEVFHVKS